MTKIKVWVSKNGRVDAARTGSVYVHHDVARAIEGVKAAALEEWAHRVIRGFKLPPEVEALFEVEITREEGA